ncbi:type VI secretion system-associated protein TagF [Pelagibaculum spongiae]|uniref:Type VI secretion system-associated protein TagF n=1 Tax=Pelagibaculum spongiae TaxID=2080658 RepID=A0A2V1GY67_9GAMM|nr:type VI secretion system-associated protein TagF [Pelagibaculum spongiae]PVZ67675.1 type VI secretion system-associated protein TagF [Pelagibaculum spongiae]
MQNSSTGFYGKMPSQGDFVSRRLPREFIHFWDHWLQNSIAYSRDQLQDSWLQTYLTSPIWRFALSPGQCDNRLWTGVMIPSVDSVGRYFPLTIALALPASTNPFTLAGEFKECYDAAEKLLLSTLNDRQFDMAKFDMEVSRLSAQFNTTMLTRSLPAADPRFIPKDDSNNWHIPQPSADVSVSYPHMLHILVRQRFPIYSLFWSKGSNQVQPCMLVSRNMPPVSGFSGMLGGYWQSGNWEDWAMSFPMASGR